MTLVGWDDEEGEDEIGLGEDDEEEEEDDVEVVGLADVSRFWWCDRMQDDSSCL